jgi:hypothetical protein
MMRSKANASYDLIVGGIITTLTLLLWFYLLENSGRPMRSEYYLIVTGCTAGPEGCGAGTATAVQVDLVTAFQNPIAQFESVLGAASFGSVFVQDLILGNNRLSLNDLHIGIDTVVSGRNFTLGFIPESNVDAWVSQSQRDYNQKRREGIEPGGSLQLSTSNLQQLGVQVFWKDTFWQAGWKNLVALFDRDSP